jgi:hypothetical protein
MFAKKGFAKLAELLLEFAARIVAQCGGGGDESEAGQPQDESGHLPKAHPPAPPVCGPVVKLGHPR